jgi:hypothetical protein
VAGSEKEKKRDLDKWVVEEKVMAVGLSSKTSFYANQSESLLCFSLHR